MSELILHHYTNSPFAEKIRSILGFKSAQWSSVMIPPIMPKPDVIALTGGYRKTPVLQIGADIYCDTSLIADIIESRYPAPTLYPSGGGRAARLFSMWADSALFWTAIPFTMQPEGLAYMFAGARAEDMQAFSQDRQAFRANISRMRLGEAKGTLPIYLFECEAMLADAPWLFGEQPSIADFSVYHCLWFILRGGPAVGAILSGYPRIVAWMERMKAFGHGTSERMTSEAAVAVAARSEALDFTTLAFVDSHGIARGTPVRIAATDYGCDPVEGEFAISTEREIGLVREDARAGRVVVHFPRVGFEVRKLD